MFDSILYFHIDIFYFSCYFDGVKGKITNICFTTIPLLIILVMNIILYFLTWQRISVEAKRLKNALGKNAKSIRASHQAARTMSLFVTAFFAQWWAMALYGMWQLIDENVPQALFQFVTTFSNIGGILNGIVYIIIRRRKTRAIKDTLRMSTLYKASQKDKPWINMIHSSRAKKIICL